MADGCDWRDGGWGKGMGLRSSFAEVAEQDVTGQQVQSNMG